MTKQYELMWFLRSKIPNEYSHKDLLALGFGLEYSIEEQDSWDSNVLENCVYSFIMHNEPFYFKTWYNKNSWDYDEATSKFDFIEIVTPREVITVVYDTVGVVAMPYVIVLENDVVLEFDSEKDMLACVKTLKKSKTVLKYLRLYDYEKVTNGN